jgi:hypothetical protein
MTDIIDLREIQLEIEKIEILISVGPIDELIQYAKEYDIHQVSNSKRYTEQVNKIKTRLIAEGIDPETIRKQ